MKKILTLFLVLIFVNISLAQIEPNDCVNAIVICGNGNFISNANGIGTIQEVSGCSGFEHNSLWLKINVIQAGTLGFDIVPNNSSILVDYDFWVFAANKDCSNLGSPIRCATTNPNLAGSSTNHTGMNGATTLTQTGPGANGNGYVRWLTVSAGQSYYIAIDRPVGDGGFELTWTGTATLNGGAFAPPPIANSISDYKTCSSTLNVGIFDLDTVRSQINPDLTSNTITFHATLADAVDGISALPNIISNTSNPQIIYARVTNNTTGCNSISNFNLVVYPVPIASLSLSKQLICSGDVVTATFSGTPNATIDYKIDGGINQSAVLDASGKFTLIETLTANRTYSLVSVKVLDAGGNTICSQSINDSKTVILNPSPVASISGTNTICYGTTASITFNGTPNSIITYTVDGGTNQTVIIDGTGTATITSPILTVNSTYTLISITSLVTPFCTQTLTDEFTVLISPLPTATISGTTPVCSGNTAIITFNGTPNATISYAVDGGANQSIVLDTAGLAVLTTPILTASSTYSLVSIVTSGTLICSNSLSDFITIIVNPLPTATISGTDTICSGTTADITFKGSSNDIITYTINGGTNQTIVLDAVGVATLTTSVLTSTTVYQLVSAASGCSQSITGSATLTVLPLPSVIISGSSTICIGKSTTINFVGTPNANVIYSINNGSNQSVILDSLGTAQISTGILITDATFSLVSITSAGIPSCSQLQIGSVTVVVVSAPTIIATPSAPTICSGETTTISLSSEISTTFSWSVSQIGVSGAFSGSGNTISQKLIATGIIQGTVIYTIALITNGCPGLPIDVKVTVNPIPEVFGTSATTICSGESPNIQMLPNIPETTFTWTVIQVGVSGASNGEGNTINQILNTTGITMGNVVYTVTPKFKECSGISMNSSVKVNPLPIPAIVDGVICVNETTGIPFQTYILDTGLNNGTYDFVWYFEGNKISGATEYKYLANQMGSYGVVATNTLTGCVSSLVNVNVGESFPAQTITISQTPAFSDNATISIHVEGGNGIYEYQLDNGAFQFSNIFSNVISGSHSVQVRDTNGCTNLSKNVLIIGYPNYFTPNGDGFHDTWNIICLDIATTKIYIYDRYGKLIKQINPSGLGWDGTYNGQSLPSTDYWFTVEYIESGINKIFKSHFAMKR